MYLLAQFAWQGNGKSGECELLASGENSLVLGTVAPPSTVAEMCRFLYLHSDSPVSVLALDGWTVSFLYRPKKPEKRA